MMSKKLTGEKLLKAAVNQILQHPETWNQKEWHSGCGTEHCIAGWCQILSGSNADANTAKTDARKALEISEADAQYLFSPDRNISQLHYFASNFNRAGFDRAGFDRAGFDRAGFDRAGFDRAGFNRAGFNRAGFDRAGFDRAGFDRAGFDRAGFDRAGFDRAGKKLSLFEV